MHKDRNRTAPNTTPVVLIRHAQSQWNKENRFTGWAEPPLTDAGVAEAVRAAHELRALLMELTGMSVAEVEAFEIPTATPIIYDFDNAARPLRWRYLGNTAHNAKSA